MEDYYQSFDQYSDSEFEEEEEEEEVMEESEEEEEEVVMEDREIEFDSWDMLERMLNFSTSYEVMWKCLRFCYLFPKSCEFQKDDMVQLWMAQGFFLLPSHGEVIEDTVGLHFEEFKRCQIFQLSRQYYSTPELRYRLNHSIVHLLQQQQDDEYVRIGDSNSQISENTLHCSLPGSSITPITLNNLYQAKRLSTLLIYHQPRVDRIPRQLFLKLPLLRVLDFSHTNITELPSSIANLKQLRYLNLSVTPITTLPEALCSLYQMRTLKLRGCLKLVGLPDDMRKLVNLHHLELDLACLLVSMPPGFGDLIKLQSLPAFVVGKEDGCQITELKNMVNLHGTLRILRLENVASSEEAKEAALDVKIHLHKLELQWTELDDDFEVLENLKPHSELGEFQIVGYGGAKFPNWIGDPSFSRLVAITIHDCRNLQLLPPLGKHPFLRDLCVSEIHEVEVIDQQFFGRNMDANVLDLGSHELGKVSGDLSDGEKYNAFPLLEKFTLYGLPKLKKWTGIEEGDFPCLQKMNVSGCPKLTALTELSVCKSLQLLEISACSSLESFPDEGLPTSLEYLVIIDCPLLKEWCHGDKGAMLARIPTVWLDYQQISWVSFTSSQTQNTEICSSRFDIGASMQTHEDFWHQAGISGHITEEELPILLRSGTDRSESNVEDTGLQQVLKGDQSGVYPTEGAHTHLEPHPSRRPTVGSTLSGGFEIERRTTTRSFLRSCFPSRSSCFPSRRKRTADTVRAKDPSSMESKSPLEVSSPSRLSESPKVTTIGSVHLSMKQVIKATKNFSPSLKVGEGRSGTVYRAQLPDGQVVAVKRATKRQHDSNLAEFRHEAEMLARIKHCNIVTLLGCVHNKTEGVIITEYCPNGSLRDHLNGQQGRILDFNQRLEISIDVAHALTYLHVYGENQIIHRDVKSSNIFLTESFRAKVADFGIARLVLTDEYETDISTRLAGTVGYIDPEYTMTGHITPKSDVYSYGILLFEILTARRPEEWYREVDEMDTLSWAFSKYNEGKVVEVLDPLMTEVLPARIVLEIFGLAFQCAAPKRVDRPNMEEVGEKLWKIKMDYLKECQETRAVDITLKLGGVETALRPLALPGPNQPALWTRGFITS